MCCLFFSDPAQISELLSKTIADAHARTCLYTLEHIHTMFRKPQDLSKLIYYKDMVSPVLSYILENNFTKRSFETKLSHELQMTSLLAFSTCTMLRIILLLSFRHMKLCGWSVRKS